MSSFRVDLPQTVCGSECLNVKKKAPLSYSKYIFLLASNFNIVEPTMEWRLSLHCMSVVLPIVHDWALTWNTRVIKDRIAPLIRCQTNANFFIRLFSNSFTLVSFLKLHITKSWKQQNNVVLHALLKTTQLKFTYKHYTCLAHQNISFQIETPTTMRFPLLSTCLHVWLAEPDKRKF